MNKKLELQIKNTLDIVKRAIFKEIIKLTPLKKFTVVPPSP
jgi:Trm5-related predicted tRNA methylase